MAWLEDPRDATKKTFIDAPLSRQGQLPTTADAILPTPSGNDYPGVNLNLRMDERHAIRVCFEVETSGERKQAVIAKRDNTKNAKTVGPRQTS